MEKTDTHAFAPGTWWGATASCARIGVGAMGEVFLGVDDSLGRRAAIKLLGIKHLENETVRERFLREARALARLSHPNLITVYESGHIGENNRPYFAMELLEGGDVEKLLLERGPLPSRRGGPHRRPDRGRPGRGSARARSFTAT